MIDVARSCREVVAVPSPSKVLALADNVVVGVIKGPITKLGIASKGIEKFRKACGGRKSGDIAATAPTTRPGSMVGATCSR